MVCYQFLQYYIHFIDIQFDDGKPIILSNESMLNMEMTKIYS